MPTRRLSPAQAVLSLLCILYFILFVDRVNISTAAPLLATDLHLRNTDLGLAFSAFAIPYAFFQLVGGWIGDRFGARIVLTTCCVLVGLSTALTGLAGGLASLAFFRLAVGFGEGAAFPTATRAMASWMPSAGWGFAQGIVHSFARIGNALTPPLVAALLAFTTWRGVFVILGFASLLWPAIWFWYFRDDPREHSAITPADLANLPLRKRGHNSSTMPWMRLARRMLPVTIVDFCYGWTLWLFLSWIPSFFFQNYGLDLQATALFSTGVFFAGVVGDTLGGVASDYLLRRTGGLVVARRSVIVTGFIGGFIFLLPVMMIHQIHVAAVCLSLAFFCVELIVGPIWSIPMDIAPRYAASASGMMNFGFGVAGIISPVTFGYLLDRTGGWIFPFSASLVLLLVGALLAARLRVDEKFERFPGYDTE